MLTPRYFFANDFIEFYPYFLTQPHIQKTFAQGAYLWEAAKPFDTLHYIISGVAQNDVAHENGHRKIISFHGSGTVFPGYHQRDFKIERSLLTIALTEMTVLEFTKAQFQHMFETNSALSAAVVEWYATYVNRLLYETAHQEYNNSFVKLCNLLYLLAAQTPQDSCQYIDMTQEDLADILGISRVHLTRGLTQLRNEHIILTRRKGITVIDPKALSQHCSLETL